MNKIIRRRNRYGPVESDLVSSCKVICLMFGVADENRTRNPQSGNLMLHLVELQRRTVFRMERR